MQIFVDADACPVVDIVETIAEKYNISTTLLCDTNHILYSDYSEVIVVGAGADAVDYKLISICHKGDVVVSQDYGVAAMALDLLIADGSSMRILVRELKREYDYEATSSMQQKFDYKDYVHALEEFKNSTSCKSRF